MKWKLIFSTRELTETQVFTCFRDPQINAQEIIRIHPHLVLIAAVKGDIDVLPADSARAQECGLDGWPEDL